MSRIRRQPVSWPPGSPQSSGTDAGGVLKAKSPSASSPSSPERLRRPEIDGRLVDAPYEPSEALLGGKGGAVEGSIEAMLQRALLPPSQASTLLKSGRVRAGIDALDQDWDVLVGQNDDPLLQIAKLALERHKLNIRDLRRALHSLIDS